jgi:hypothetical protein
VKDAANAFYNKGYTGAERRLEYGWSVAGMGTATKSKGFADGAESGV